MSLGRVIVALAFGAAVVMFATSGFLSAAASEDVSYTPAEKEVFAAIDGYNKALSRKDLGACMGFFMPGPDTMVLGTGPGESWRGPEEIRDAHVNFFKGYDKETTEPVWRQIQIVGDVAWTAAMSRHVDFLKGEKREFFLNISAVFQKKDGKWRFALIHFSNLTGPEKK